MTDGALAASDRRVHRLTGIYHADGSVLGELRYLVGRTLGRAHCALCDITHGTVRVKPEWVDARARISVPFDAVHLDERAPDVRAASEGRTPCVLAHTDDGIELLLGPDDLERCHGDPATLVDALTAEVTTRGWRFAAA